VIPNQLDAKGAALPVVHCPVCNYRMDSAVSVGSQSRPRPGDLSLCAKCGEILVYDENMGVRQPLVKEMVELPQDVHHNLEVAQNTIRRERVIP
jgi:transcription initiation factor IIE alpha subunit